MCDTTTDANACTSTGLQPIYYDPVTHRMVLGPTGGCTSPTCRLLSPNLNLDRIEWTTWTTKPTETWRSMVHATVNLVTAGTNNAAGTISGPGGVVTVTAPYAGMNQTADAMTPVEVTSNWGTPGTGLNGSVNGTPIRHMFNFSSPVCNPVFSFQSIGNAETPITIEASAPYAVVNDIANMTWVDSTHFVGVEGFAEVMFLGTHSNISFVSDTVEFYTVYSLGMPVYKNGLPSICSPQECDTTVDGAGRLMVYRNGQWITEGSSVPCVVPVASLPANAAQAGYDCATKCFYVVPSTAKDAAGNTLTYDSSRKSWGYIEWANWTSSTAGGSAGIASPATTMVAAGAVFNPMTVTGTNALPVPVNVTAEIQFPIPGLRTPDPIYPVKTSASNGPVWRCIRDIGFRKPRQ